MTYVCNEEQLAFRTQLTEMKKGTVIHKENWELVMLSGKQITVAVSVTVGKVTASRGGTTELRWLLRDITKRKQMDEEKAKRAAELVIANKERAFQDEEKEKRAAELVVANKELAFQNVQKEERAADLVIANIELAFQITIYILVGIIFEERKLVKQYGTVYIEYRKVVPALIPFAKK